MVLYLQMKSTCASKVQAQYSPELTSLSTGGSRGIIYSLRMFKPNSYRSYCVINFTFPLLIDEMTIAEQDKHIVVDLV